MPVALTFDLVSERLGELLRLPSDRFTPDTTLDELGLESFLMIEFVVDLQEEFDTHLSQDDLRKIRTLGDLTSLLAGGARA